MGLVDDDGVAAVGQLPDLVEDEGELLQRRDDDAGLLPRQGLGQLGRVLVDLHHDATGVLELVDGLLKLAVEDDAVGDDDDLVEDLGVGGVVEVGEPVGGPGDGVGLARPSRVLDEVALPGPAGLGVGLQGQHGVPLVVAGEDDRLGRSAGRWATPGWAARRG